MTGSGRRDQLDFIAHAERSLKLDLDFDALGAQICHDHVHTSFFDGPQAPGGYPQADETPFRFQPEAVSVQIG
jgi:hypothetical protein